MARVTVTRASEVASRARADAPPRVDDPISPPAPGGGEALEGWERWTWRHRRQLAPLGLLLALVALLGMAHEARPDLAWAALLVVPVASIAVIVILRGEGDRAFVVRCIAPAALWSTCCWWVGLDDPVVAGAGLVGAAALLALWWRRSSPRGRIEVIGGSRWPFTEGWRFAREARRELGHVDAIWPWIAKRSGVEGARLRRLMADFEDGYALHLDLVRGQLGKDIRSDRLASALREFQVGAILTPDPARPWEVVLVEHLQSAEPVLTVMEEAG